MLNILISEKVQKYIIRMCILDILDMKMLNFLTCRKHSHEYLFHNVTIVVITGDLFLVLQNLFYAVIALSLNFNTLNISVTKMLILYRFWEMLCQ